MSTISWSPNAAGRVRQRHRLLEQLLREQDDRELVPADTSERIERPHQPAESACDREENGIADRGADLLADLFEAVEIEGHDRGAGRLGAVALGQSTVKPIEEQLAIG